MRNAIPIATTRLLSPQAIAFNEVGRQAIMADPDWNERRLLRQDAAGQRPGAGPHDRAHHLPVRRVHEQKFGRELKDKDDYGYDFVTEFQVESYLQHQGDTFVKRFDANSYLYITKAMDYFDLAKDGSLDEGFGRQEPLPGHLVLVGLAVPVLPVEGDRQGAAANNVDVSYCEIKSTTATTRSCSRPGR